VSISHRFDNHMPNQPNSLPCSILSVWQYDPSVRMLDLSFGLESVLKLLEALIQCRVTYVEQARPVSNPHLILSNSTWDLENRRMALLHLQHQQDCHSDQAKRHFLPCGESRAPAARRSALDREVYHSHPLNNIVFTWTSTSRILTLAIHVLTRQTFEFAARK
jgi:hypothetical protein